MINNNTTENTANTIETSILFLTLFALSAFLFVIIKNNEIINSNDRAVRKIIFVEVSSKVKLFLSKNVR